MSKKNKKGLTLVELIIVIIFIAILTAISLPRLNIAAVYGQKADAQAKKIVTLLRRTRRLAISDAAANTAGFRLKFLSTSPYSQLQIINLDTDAVVDDQNIDLKVTCTGSDTFDFGPLGNLINGFGAQLNITAGGKTFNITVISATGMVKCSQI